MKKSPINSWYGWVPDRPDYRDKLYSAIAAPPKTLPAKVDLRAGCSPVEDQGQLGSCTANALVGNLEFLEKKAGHTVTDLSRLFIYYNERSMEGTINEDSGAAIRDGVKSLVNLGVCPEKSWPYTISGGLLQGGGQPPGHFLPPHSVAAGNAAMPRGGLSVCFRLHRLHRI